MNGNFGKDFTHGSIVKHLLFFALPILLSNLVTTGYSIINAIWVGNLLGSDAMGAATVSFPVNVLMIAFISGFTMALSVLVARYYAQGEHEQMQKVVNNCWTVGYIFILLIIALGFTFSPQIITFLGTPAPIREMATGYLRITFLEFIFTYISAVIASALRGIGNSITPMIFMIAGTVLNAVFDPLLIIGIGPFPKLGLNGAAFASLIAFAVTTIVLVIYMYTKYRDKPITFKKLAFDRKILASVLHIGFPSFVQNALFSVSSAFMISFVNGFGENAISGFGIATRIESIAILPGMAVMMAISTLTAQHFGVNKVKRIKDIFKWGAVLNASMVFVVSGLILIFAQPLVSLFVSNKAIIDI